MIKYEKYKKLNEIYLLEKKKGPYQDPDEEEDYKMRMKYIQGYEDGRSSMLYLLEADNETGES